MTAPNPSTLTSRPVGRPLAEFCKRGHVMAENRTPTGCRTCKLEHSRQWNREHAAEFILLRRTALRAAKIVANEDVRLAEIALADARARAEVYA